MMPEGLEVRKMGGRAGKDERSEGGGAEGEGGRDRVKEQGRERKRQTWSGESFWRIAGMI